MLFTDSQIYNIYSKYIIKDQSYFDRFKDISEYFSPTELEKYCNMDAPRVVSIIDFKQWIAKYNIKHTNSLLYTDSSDPELQYLTYDYGTHIPYPKFDLHNLNLTQKNYNFAILNQTIEHLYNPFLCINNLYNHLSDGGYLYTTVPIINIPHMVPIHFWGLTPISLCLLMIGAGFRVLECGYWGNQKYIDYIFNNNNWPGYKDISENYNLGYDDVCQSQTWILVQK